MSSAIFSIIASEILRGDILIYLVTSTSFYVSMNLGLLLSLDSLVIMKVGGLPY